MQCDENRLGFIATSALASHRPRYERRMWDVQRLAKIGCGSEPRKIVGADSLCSLDGKHVRHRYAACRRPAWMLAGVVRRRRGLSTCWVGFRFLRVPGRGG
jgi:hypothetical protein